MKKFLFILPVILMPLLVAAQLNMVQLGHLPYTNNLNDVWGYTDSTGIEYALVGVKNGTSIVSLADPASPVEVAFSPGANSIWRDIKVFQHYAYVSNETSGGIKIIDLQYLPDSIHTWQWTGNNGVTFKSAHNVFVDEQGYLFVIGSNYGVGGAIIANLNPNPVNPVVETVYNSAYIHDLFARGDTMWSAEIYHGWFAAVDISDKTPPLIPGSKIMATHGTPNTFTHNCWLSDDGKYLYTTDEQPNAFLAAYDVSDLNNVHEVDRIQSNPGSNVIPHNVFVHGNFLVASYYRDGIVVVDATHPDNLIQTGYFDTSPFSGNGFNGSWGCYPFFPSGNILASDIEQGLFIIKPTYTQACYLEGMVKDSATNAPINGVLVSIQGANSTGNTNLLGVYKTGIPDSGTYQITFFKLGYEPKTLVATLDNGVITTLNAKLKPLIPFSLSGMIQDSSTGNGIDHCNVILKGIQYNFQTTTDQNGNFSFPSIYADTYNLIAGRWAYQTRMISGLNLNQTSSGQTLLLQPGYYDDFALDFGWSVSGNASSGMWEKGKPAGTVFGSKPANPGQDLPNDISNECFVTGNGGGGAGADDIDNGYTLLRSPLFDLSNYQDPILNFDRWFFNDGGNGNPNDSLIIYIFNGSTTATIDLAVNGDPKESEWAHKNIRLKDFIIPTAQMKLFVYAADRNPGHLVEAGFDGFKVHDSLYVPLASFHAQPDSGCAPLSVQFIDSSAHSPAQWHWLFPGSLEDSSNLQNPLIHYDTSGFFDVQLIVSNASGSDTISISNYIQVLQQPIISFTIIPSGTGNNGSATANVTGGTPPYQYQWNDPDTQTTATASNLAQGVYSVTVSDINGCSSIDSVTIPISNSLIDNSSTTNIRLFPNPNQGSFAIKLSKDFNINKALSWQICNTQGQLISQGFFKSDANKLIIHSNLIAGVYLFRLIDLKGRTIWHQQFFVY